jgi:hypothetical protein
MRDISGHGRFFTSSDSTARDAAVAAAVGFAGTAVREIALAVGAPLGRAAWGSASAHLSIGQRVESGVAVVAKAAAALIVLGRAGMWPVGKRDCIAGELGTWFLGGLSALAAVMNFVSGSGWENFIFGPTAVVLAVLCFLVATGAQNGGPRTTRSR